MALRHPSAKEPQRRDERYPADVTVMFEGGSGAVRNISASGIYFVTDAALREGQPVKFSVDFDHFPSGPIAVSCIARIVRVEEQGAKRGVAAEISDFEFRRIHLLSKSSSDKKALL
jgi:PilZ domain